MYNGYDNLFYKLTIQIYTLWGQNELLSVVRTTLLRTCAAIEVRRRTRWTVKIKRSKDNENITRIRRMIRNRNRRIKQIKIVMKGEFRNCRPQETINSLQGLTKHLYLCIYTVSVVCHHVNK